MSTFSTERLPLATAIHASERLKFTGCKHLAPDRVAFAFDDPDGEGARAELEFDSGGLLVPAAKLWASLRYLRREMTETLNTEKRNTRHARRQ